MQKDILPFPVYQICLYFWSHQQKSEHGINTLFLQCVDECPMYIHANFQYTTIYNKKVTREEAELSDQPS